MTPEQRKAAQASPGIAQQIGDDRGGGLTRFGDALVMELPEFRSR